MAATTPLTFALVAALVFALLHTPPANRPTAWVRGLLWGILLVPVMRFVEILVPQAPALTRLINEAFAGFGGSFGLESAAFALLFALSLLFRIDRPIVGATALVAICGMTCIVILELAYLDFVLGGEISAFSILSQICLGAAVLLTYRHNRYFRVLFLRNMVGRQTRYLALWGFLLPMALGGLHAALFQNETNAVLGGAVLVGVIAASFLGAVLFLGVQHEAADKRRRRAERVLVVASRTDPLTGALNRLRIGELLDRALDDQRRGTARWGVILFDLDHFKAINDTRGHAAGDVVLRAVVRLIRPHLRAGDAIARWGGEEFLVLLAVETDAELAAVAERLREVVEKGPASQDGAGDWSATASFGVSAIRAVDSSSAQVVARADRALYAAKAAGRNRVRAEFAALIAEGASPDVPAMRSGRGAEVLG